MGCDDLFLDSGVIYGDIDRYDPWHDPCRDHFEKYPRGVHNYYSVKRIIDIEIKTVSRKRRETGSIKSDRIVKLIVKTGKALFDNNEIKDIDYVNTKKEIYNGLFKVIHNLLLTKRVDGNPKDRDAHLLTNALLWCNEEKSLHNPYFITTDRKDIKRNETEILAEATLYLRTAHCLKFCLITPKQAS